MPSLKWTNAQVFLVTEFPWSVTVAWMGSYLSLFLLDQGLSARNLGWTIGAGAVIQLLGLGLSLTRRLGRKGTIMSGDFGGWVVVLGVWALSHNPWILTLGQAWRERAAHTHQGLSGPEFYLAALRVLSMVPFLIVAAFVALALVSPHGPHVAPGDLALLPLGVVSGIILLGVGRRIARRWTVLHFMGMGLALVAAGFAVLAWAPQGHVIWILAGWGLMVAGQSQFASSHTSIWMTWLPDVIRVEVQGWIWMVTAAGVAVLSPLLADQFVRNPRVVFGIMAGVFTAALGLWRPLRKLMAQNEHNEP